MTAQVFSAIVRSDLLTCRVAMFFGGISVVQQIRKNTADFSLLDVRGTNRVGVPTLTCGQYVSRLPLYQHRVSNNHTGTIPTQNRWTDPAPAGRGLLSRSTAKSLTAIAAPYLHEWPRLSHHPKLSNPPRLGCSIMKNAQEPVTPDLATY